jgi:hypothetical protein
LMYSLTARMRSSYEYMDYLLIVQDFVRIPVHEHAAFYTGI